MSAWAAPVADEPGEEPDRRLDEIADLLDRLPPDDPAVAQLLAEAMLSALRMNRSVLGDDRVAAHYERLAERWPADHPLVPYVKFMSRSVRYVQAFLARDSERADAMYYSHCFTLRT